MAHSSKLAHTFMAWLNSEAQAVEVTGLASVQTPLDF